MTRILHIGQPQSLKAKIRELRAAGHNAVEGTDATHIGRNIWMTPIDIEPLSEEQRQAGLEATHDRSNID